MLCCLCPSHEEAPGKTQTHAAHAESHAVSKHMLLSATASQDPASHMLQMVFQATSVIGRAPGRTTRDVRILGAKRGLVVAILLGLGIVLLYRTHALLSLAWGLLLGQAPHLIPGLKRMASKAWLYLRLRHVLCVSLKLARQVAGLDFQKNCYGAECFKPSISSKLRARPNQQLPSVIFAYVRPARGSSCQQCWSR